jgi:hypothetical protein
VVLPRAQAESVRPRLQSGRRRRARSVVFDLSAAYASAGPSTFTISRRECLSSTLQMPC